MSKFAKGNWTTDANHVRLSMPIAKVNEDKRTVSGFATLDNIDSQGDVVTQEASAKAFARARGNLREMHQPLAVGRVVDFREDEFFDQESGEFYRGIFVTARVSTGAEDTWQKVLDGTLSGFSIGGEINEASNEFVKEAGRTVRFITDYDLVELSLVDNPANQLANVFSIQKSATGSVTVEGMVAETVIESVFICRKDNEVKISREESEVCFECGTKMENAGWYEAGEDRTEKVRDIVSKFLSPSVKEAAPENADSEGGVDMGTKNDDVEKGRARRDASYAELAEEDAAKAADEEAADVDEVEEEEEPKKAPKKSKKAELKEKEEESDDDEDAEEDEPVEAESPEEVHDDEDEISKKIDALHHAVKDSLEKTRTETSEQVKELEKKLEAINETFSKRASELETKFDEFGNKLEAAKGRLADFEKSLDAINSSDAVRKSADLEVEEPAGNSVQKSVWNGAFSGKPRGFSVDQL